MPQLIVIAPDGEEQAVTAGAGLSVMEVIRDAGIDGVPALCGGCCSCATCHVHVDPKFAAKMPKMTEDEDGLLDSTSDRSEYSRLSCQLPFNDAFDGMRVTVAAGDGENAGGSGQTATIAPVPLSGARRA